jgi:CHAD domain-containing protein
MTTSGESRPALLLRERVAALRRTLPGARSGDVRDVHQARVATRRLREVLPLIAAGKAGRRLARVAKNLTGVLGTVRELDVALQMLDELAKTDGVRDSAIAALRTTIAGERVVLQQETTEEIDAADVERLQRKAFHTLERRDGQRRGPVDLQAQVVEARRRGARRARRVEAAVDAAGAIYLPERLHQVRITVKKLRYALEIARDLSRSRAEARIRFLKRMQDLLGRMHDLEVLVARTRGLQAAAVRDLQLSSDLDQLVRLLETEARQLHGHYLAERRALLDLCSRVIATAEPRKVA